MDIFTLYKESVAIYLSAILCSIILAKIYDTNRFNMSKAKKYFYYFIIISPFAFIIGFRRYDVGWDTYTYVSVLKEENFGEKSLEYAFRFLIKTVSCFNSNRNYTVFFVIIAFVTVYVYLLSIEIYKENSPITLSLFLYYMFLGLNMADQMRQMLAISFFMCAVGSILKNKYKSFVIYSFIACGMHTSVIAALMAFFPIYFFSLYKVDLFSLATVKIRFHTKLILFMIACVSFIAIGNGILLKSLLKIVPSHYTYLITQLNVSVIGMGYFLDISLAAGVVFLFRNQKKARQENILYSYVCFSFVFRLLGYYSFFIARLNHYSLAVGTLLIPYLINKQRIKKWIIILLGIVYMGIYYIGTNQKSNFPYHFFWEK